MATLDEICGVVTFESANTNGCLLAHASVGRFNVHVTDEVGGGANFELGCLVSVEEQSTRRIFYKIVDKKTNFLGIEFRDDSGNLVDPDGFSFRVFKASARTKLTLGKETVASLSLTHQVDPHTVATHSCATCWGVNGNVRNVHLRNTQNIEVEEISVTI